MEFSGAAAASANAIAGTAGSKPEARNACEDENDTKGEMKTKKWIYECTPPPGTNPQNTNTSQEGRKTSRVIPKNANVPLKKISKQKIKNKKVLRRILWSPGEHTVYFCFMIGKRRSERRLAFEGGKNMIDTRFLAPIFIIFFAGAKRIFALERTQDAGPRPPFLISCPRAAPRSRNASFPILWLHWYIPLAFAIYIYPQTCAQDYILPEKTNR